MDIPGHWGQATALTRTHTCKKRIKFGQMTSSGRAATPNWKKIKLKKVLLRCCCVGRSGRVCVRCACMWGKRSPSFTTKSFFAFLCDAEICCPTQSRLQCNNWWLTGKDKHEWMSEMKSGTANKWERKVFQINFDARSSQQPAAAVAAPQNDGRCDCEKIENSQFAPGKSLRSNRKFYYLFDCVHLVYDGYDNDND